MKQIFKYLNYGLIYDSSVKLQLHGYDIDYVNDITMGKPIFMMRNGIVCLQRQKSVSLSTNEAEYIVLSQAVQELTWLMLLISDLLETQVGTLIVYVDNQCHKTCEESRIP